MAVNMARDGPGSWASTATRTSTCSLYSTPSPRPPLATNVHPWPDGATHPFPPTQPTWANPGGSVWPSLDMQDAPWSLPYTLGVEGVIPTVADTLWSLPPPQGVVALGHDSYSSTAGLVGRAVRARRTSVVAALLSIHDPTPSRPPTPRHAPALSQPALPHYRDPDGCGNTGVEAGGGLSMVLNVPTKLEALVKFLAHSLHLMLSAVCPRKARRKERDNPAALEAEHKLYLEEAVLERKIPETDLRQLVELPPGLGYEEWLASHTIDFFQHINLLYGTVCEYCTMSGCPDMVGPTTRQYLWFDEKGKKTKVAAPQYVDYVMTFTQKTINDESIFPTKFENDFPVSFESIVKKIQRLLFHVVAHLYHSHFREMVLLNLHAHLNCIFAHFILFNEKFGLIDDKETEVLGDLVVALKLYPEREPPEGEGTGGAPAASDTLTTSTCSQIVGLDCNSSLAADETTTGGDSISCERECGDCSASQDHESTVADSGAVSCESSSGVAPEGECPAGTDTPLLDTGAGPDTRP